MTVLRIDPFRELERWSNQAWGQANRVRSASLAFDAVRRDNELVLQFDLPGVNPDSIEVTVEHNTLTVAAERRAQRQESDRAVVTERWAGRYLRRLALGEGLDTSQVAADYDAGVLTVTVPVADEIKPHQVAVTVGSGDRTATGKVLPTEGEHQVDAA